MPSFSPDSRGSILGLSNEVSFISESLWKGDENLKDYKKRVKIYGRPCKRWTYLSLCLVNKMFIVARRMSGIFRRTSSLSIRKVATIESISL